MTNKIIKQIWNQRRMNSWIFIEIIIAGFFLWTVIDPMYVLTVTHLKDKGYEEKGRYVMKLGAYGHNHGLRDTTLTAEHRKEAFLRITKLMGEQPEIEVHYICLNQSLLERFIMGCRYDRIDQRKCIGKNDSLSEMEVLCFTRSRHLPYIGHKGCYNRTRNEDAGKEFLFLYF